MQKRQFLCATALAGLTLPGTGQARAPARSAAAPVLLTLGGDVGKGNRGPLDPALDQLMVKHKVSFQKAHVFDFAAVTALPVVTIRPTLEYDGKPHTLKGPLVTDVLKAAGVAGRPAIIHVHICSSG